MKRITSISFSPKSPLDLWSLAARRRKETLARARRQELEGADAVQQPCGRVGNPQDIAQMVLFLCSPKAGFITGENICIDGGMTRLMIYHGDNGWMLNT